MNQKTEFSISEIHILCQNDGWQVHGLMTYLVEKKQAPQDWGADTTSRIPRAAVQEALLAKKTVHIDQLMLLDELTIGVFSRIRYLHDCYANLAAETLTIINIPSIYTFLWGENRKKIDGLIVDVNGDQRDCDLAIVAPRIKEICIPTLFLPTEIPKTEEDCKEDLHMMTRLILRCNRPKRSE